MVFIFLGVCLEKDFIFCLERMSNSSAKIPDVGKTNGKCSSSVGVGIAILVIFLILMLLFSIGTYTEWGIQNFANIKSKLSSFGNSGDLRSLDIVMFMKPTCPWCKKMIDVLDSAGQLKNITVVDISKPEGATMAQQFGADKQPVPSFISRKNKVGTVGYRDSVGKLIDALKQPSAQQTPGSSEEPGMPGQIDIDFIKSLQIVLFAREGCGHCTHAKSDISQAGLTDVIQIVDIMTPEGQSMAGQMLPPGTAGVPAFVSMATKKHVVGYRSLDQLVQALHSGNVPNEMS
jgi:glutaredoxin